MQPGHRDRWRQSEVTAIHHLRERLLCGGGVLEQAGSGKVVRDVFEALDLVA